MELESLSTSVDSTLNASIQIGDVSLDTTEPTGQCKEIEFTPEMFTPDSMRLLGKSDTHIVGINLVTGEQEITLDASQIVVRTALSPNGEILAWALEDNTIQFVRFNDGEVLHTLRGHTQVIDALEFSVDGARLFSGSYDGMVKIWDSQGNLVDELLPGGMEVMGLAISPDGSRLVTVTFEGPQKLWNLATKTVITELSQSGASSPAEAVFSSDGGVVGIAPGGGPVSLWKVPEGSLIWSGGNFALAISNDGRYLAYSDVNADDSNKIVITTTNGNEMLHTLLGGSAFAWRLFFSPDGRWLVEASEAARVWDVMNGELVYVFKAECP